VQAPLGGYPGGRRTGPRLLYFIAGQDLYREGLAIRLYHQRPLKGGGWGKIRELRLVPEAVPDLVDDAGEREVVELLVHLAPAEHSAERYALRGGRHHCSVPPLYQERVLSALANTGRLGWIDSIPADPAHATPLAWDGGAPWRLRLSFAPAPGGYELRGELWRSPAGGDGDDETVALSEPRLLTRSGLVYFADRVARHDCGDRFPWIAALRGSGVLFVPPAEADTFVAELASVPGGTGIAVSPELRMEVEKVAPRPELAILAPDPLDRSPGLPATLVFRYGDCVCAWTESRPTVADSERRTIHPRDTQAEANAVARLLELGFRRPALYDRHKRFHIGRDRLPAAVPQLLDEGWAVEAEGRPLRRASTPRFSVAGGIDWFELGGAVDFEGQALSVPELLRAVRAKQRMVRLGDGTTGVLPAEWLERYAPLAALAGAQEPGSGDSRPANAGADTGVRFHAAQAGFLDALLAAEERVATDRRFDEARERLRSVRALPALSAPRGFHGELRPYQEAGLAWLQFLSDTGLGGCLADDMGLGKTVQILAFLQRRRAAGETRRGPSLVVAPRSLVFNWCAEAERFTPRLRTVAYTGPERAERLAEQPQADLLVTTYGTLLRDIGELRSVPLDCAVLDEAHAIKNPATQTAKACRLLDASVRLALTGTPVENHLGDLLSIFEFLNPGMLGRRKAAALAGARASDRELEILRRGLAPLILRRTKEEVLSDLPPKSEQTLLCELEPAERRRYDELAAHYRAALRSRVEEMGIARAKIHVLEALLRLRQAACHPGLLDRRRKGAKSAKLTALLEQIDEVLEGSHKAIVFSQFTTLLGIVRDRLDGAGIAYEYLDGRTRKRVACVRRFQEDDDCRLFLVSLKAGGHGLNLTAADYVFLLDPWWNPAVESQAIDRAHRIGQERPVFAYRLIARDTVEEKIVELQAEKRRLAEAIVTSNRSLMRELTVEDLERLLA
jgi:superfamily II DNA or RNA helicase